jgi:DNA-binding transcriptional ArsR family regulator
MREFITLTKALADENRVRILCSLQNKELCVCQIVALLGLAASTVSKHLSILHHARLVESQKKGRWVYYRLAGSDAPKSVQQAVSWMFTVLTQSQQIQADQQAMVHILNVSPEELCNRLQADQ